MVLVVPEVVTMRMYVVVLQSVSVVSKQTAGRQGFREAAPSLQTGMFVLADWS
jgi:hypothetical protein